MYRHTITIPDVDGDGIPVPYYRARVERTLTEAYGGYTAVRVSGAWKDPEGIVHHDGATRFEVLTETREALWMRAFARRVAKDLQQQAVLVTHESLDVEFIDGE